MTVSERLKRLIDRRNLFQSEVADAAGMTRQQLSYLLSGGTSNPRIDTVEKILKAINATMAELYEEELEVKKSKKPTPKKSSKVLTTRKD
jgi:transcriptional regulator with XRE-family HTH domain